MVPQSVELICSNHKRLNSTKLIDCLLVYLVLFTQYFYCFGIIFHKIKD